MLMSAGTKGKRFMLPHATAMLHQPRVPPTGARQASEVQIKWEEVLAEKKDYIDILHRTTGQSHEKLEADMQRPLYMQPTDAVEYGLIDGIVTSQAEKSLIGETRSAAQYDKDAGLRAVPQRPPPSS